MTNYALKITSMSSIKNNFKRRKRSYLGVDASLWNTSNIYSTNPTVVRKLRLRSHTQFLKNDWRTTAGAFYHLINCTVIDWTMEETVAPNGHSLDSRVTLITMTSILKMTHAHTHANTPFFVVLTTMTHTVGYA